MGWDRRKLINAVRWGIAMLIPFSPFVLAIVFLRSEEGKEIGTASVIFLALMVSTAILLPLAFLYVMPGAYAFNRGRIAFFNGDSQKAFKFISRAVQARDNFHTARTLYASFLIPTAQAQEALASLDKVIAAKKRYMPAYYNRAIAKDALKDYTGAMADINEAIRLKPNFAFSYAVRAGIHYDLKEYPQAIKDAQKSVQLRQANPLAYFVVGKTLLELKNYQAAVDAFSLAIKYDPKIGDFYHHRGRALRCLEKLSSALDDLNQAVKVSPNKGMMLFERGVIYIAMKQYEQARADYDEVIRLAPDIYPPYVNRGITWYFQDDYENAKADFAQALALQENGHAYISLGYIQLIEGDYPTAITNFAKGQSLTPEFKGGAVGLALAHFLQGDVEKAREIWLGLVKDEPRFQEVEWVVEEHGQHPTMAALIRRIFAEGQIGEITNSPTGQA